MQPIDYQIDVQDPFKSALQGYEVGTVIAGRQAQMAEQQSQRMIVMQMQEDLAGLASNPNTTGEDYARMISKYPHLAEQLSSAYNLLDTEKQKTIISHGLQIYSALQNNEPKIAKQLSDEWLQSAKNSGNTSEIQRAEILSKYIDHNPKLGVDSIGLTLAAAMGPKNFANTIAKLQPQTVEERLIEKQPKETRQEYRRRLLESKIGTTITAEQISPELRAAVESGKIDPNQLNSKTLPILNDLAKTSSLTNVGKGVSPELIKSINEGLINPSKVNSRTIRIWNDLARANVNATGAAADIEGKTKAYKDAVAYASLSKRTISVLDKNMPLLETLAGEVNQLGIPIIDNGYTSIRAKATNNPDVIKYVNTIKTLRAEYANMLSKGSQVTEQMRHEATEAIPSGLSADGYRALKEQLELEGRNVLDAANESATSIKFGNAGKAPITPTERQETTVTTPDGQIFTFPDQESANSFKRAAGIQ